MRTARGRSQPRRRWPAAARRCRSTHLHATIALRSPSLLLVCAAPFCSQLVLPLWQPSTESSHVFEELLEWHDERFGRKPDAPRLNGAMLESDRAAWEEAKNKS